MSDVRSRVRPNLDEGVHLTPTAEVLKGSWVGTFDAFRLVDAPQSDNTTITLPNFSPGTVMLCVKFDSNGNVTGETRRNTSGNQIARDAFTGTASVGEHVVFQ